MRGRVIIAVLIGLGGAVWLNGCSRAPQHTEPEVNRGAETGAIQNIHLSIHAESDELAGYAKITARFRNKGSFPLAILRPHGDSDVALLHGPMYHIYRAGESHPVRRNPHGLLHSVTIDYQSLRRVIQPGTSADVVFLRFLGPGSHSIRLEYQVPRGKYAGARAQTRQHVPRWYSWPSPIAVGSLVSHEISVEIQ